MGSPISFREVIKIVKAAAENSQIIVVVSAMEGVTNELEKLAELALQNEQGQVHLGLNGIIKRHEEVVMEVIGASQQEDALKLIQEIVGGLQSILTGVSLVQDLSSKSMARIITTGELLTSQLLHLAFHENDSVLYLDSSELIITDVNDYLGAEVKQEETEARMESLNNTTFSIAIAPGFIASNGNGQVTTLGRGGSDYTAALFAAGLTAELLEIWTDVSGIYSADPRLVKTAYPIDVLSFQEVMELSHFGAKVIYPPALYPSFSKGIEILVKNTFEPDQPGSSIVNGKMISNQSQYITGFSSINDISILTLSGSGMVGVTGLSARFFSALAKYKVNVILITQASSEHSICIAIKNSQAEDARKALLEEFGYEKLIAKVDEPLIEHDFSIIAIVGERMNQTKGISGKAFSELGANGINIHAIAQGASELNISFVIKAFHTKKALNVLHDAFLLTDVKRMHLYIMGIGNIGKKLLELISQQKEYLLKEKNLELVVAGIANSRKMLLQDAINFEEDWMNTLNTSGEPSNIKAFISQMKAMDIDHSIFIDNTANEELPSYYPEIFEASIPVVTCNKIAASSEYLFYRKLKEKSLANKTTFLFESNVGAGLPIIRTINHLLSSGDKIQRIEAILSGSLNYIMNAFHAGQTFRTAVEGAMEAGLTEPDPRIDLSGTDVARKILILARESGYELEMEEIQCDVFLPEACMQADSVADFLELLDQHDDHFRDLLKKAEQEKGLLRFVAKFEPNQSSVGLQIVQKSSPFYEVEGKDNIVSITSRWYNEQPLVIKGAGAGAEVTSSGIFSDILSLVSY